MICNIFIRASIETRRRRRRRADGGGGRRRFQLGLSPGRSLSRPDRPLSVALGSPEKPGKCLLADKEYPLTRRPHLFRRGPRRRCVFVKIFKCAMCIDRKPIPIQPSFSLLRREVFARQSLSHSSGGNATTHFAERIRGDGIANRCSLPTH